MEVADETIQSVQYAGFNPVPFPKRFQPGTKKRGGFGVTCNAKRIRIN